MTISTLEPQSSSQSNEQSPSTSSKPSRVRWSLTQTALIIGLLFIIAANLKGLADDFFRIASVRKHIPHQPIAAQFQGLEQFTQNISHISYLTDKNLANDEALKEFSQAQYLLTPTVLDPVNLTHEYALIVCQHPANALKLIQEHQLVPLKRSPNGIILARKQRVAP